MDPVVIAVDGPACSGKGTIAERLARELRFGYLDTGILYRAATLYAFRLGLDPKVASNARFVAGSLGWHQCMSADDDELYGEAVSGSVAYLAQVPEVRNVMLQFQRRFPSGKGVVVDGRDIGTVIFPNADLKFFVTAELEVRALRAQTRFREMGRHVEFQTLVQDLALRDKRDREREHAPLKPAEDAIIIDTTNMDKEEAYSEVFQLVSSRLSERVSR